MLYQGDEIGLGDVTVEPPDLRDPLGVRYWPAYAGRDAMRTPMHWRDAPGGGFTDPAPTPWLPLGDTTLNVERRPATPASMLALARDLIALRRRTPDLALGSYALARGAGGRLGLATRRASRGVRQLLRRRGRGRRRRAHRRARGPGRDRDRPRPRR